MKLIVLFLLVFIPYAIYSQDGTGKADDAFLDSIYREMDEILELMAPRKSFATVSLGAGTGFYNYRAGTTRFNRERKLLMSPSAAYLHKSGLGLSASAYILGEGGKLNVYQYAATPSFDYIKRGKFTTGVAFTHYFTKDDLAFYTTPIQNEAYAYFTYKKPWLQPGATFVYGWGSRTQFEERRIQLLGLRRKRNPTLVTVQSDESVRDMSTLFSVRHDFYFNKVINDRDLVSITPVLMLSAGTQSFGFNTSFQTQSKVAGNFLPNNQYVKDDRSFDTQSATMILRGDYSLGMFFFQTQLLFDYYLHTVDKRFNYAASMVGGINF